VCDEIADVGGLLASLADAILSDHSLAFRVPDCPWINAPNALMVYATIDAAPLLSLAGHTTKAVEYLLGNHTIAETMFRTTRKRCCTRRCGS
jgi:hypothetical protein